MPRRPLTYTLGRCKDMRVVNRQLTPFRSQESQSLYSDGDRKMKAKTYISKWDSFGHWLTPWQHQMQLRSVHLTCSDTKKSKTTTQQQIETCHLPNVQSIQSKMQPMHNQPLQWSFWYPSHQVTPHSITGKLKVWESLLSLVGSVENWWTFFFLKILGWRSFGSHVGPLPQPTPTTNKSPKSEDCTLIYSHQWILLGVCDVLLLGVCLIVTAIN